MRSYIYLKRDWCQSPSPEVVCTAIYRYRASESQGICTVCTLSEVISAILVGHPIMK